MAKDKDYEIKLASYRRYIMFLEDLLAIDSPFVVYKLKGQIIDEMGKNVKKDFQDFCTDNVKGRYYPYENVLFINLDLHQNQEEYISITHEFRHAYQNFALESYKLGECWEDKELLDKWKDNLENVVSSGENGYFNQPLELDAFAFTEHVIKNVFHVGIQIYETYDKTLYRANLSRMQEDFTTEEIQDSLSYVGFAFLS